MFFFFFLFLGRGPTKDGVGFENHGSCDQMDRWSSHSPYIWNVKLCFPTTCHSKSMHTVNGLTACENGASASCIDSKQAPTSFDFDLTSTRHLGRVVGSTFEWIDNCLSSGLFKPRPASQPAGHNLVPPVRKANCAWNPRNAPPISWANNNNKWKSGTSGLWESCWPLTLSSPPPGATPIF